MTGSCENKMVVSGDIDRIREFDAAFKGYQASWDDSKLRYPSYCFNALYPIPEEIVKNETDGHDWCLKNWSVAWDCVIKCAEANPGCIKYKFYTFLYPPYLWALEVSKRWPDIRIVLLYFDGEYAGEMIFENGEIIEDTEYGCDEHEYGENEYHAFVYNNFGWNLAVNEDPAEDANY